MEQIWIFYKEKCEKIIRILIIIRGDKYDAD